jgi:hypothetical protein
MSGPSLRIGAITLVGALVAAVAGGCSSAPEPLALPPVDLRVDYEPAPAGDAATDPLAFTVEVLAIAAPLPGDSVQLQALVIESESGHPFRGATRLSAGTRWLTGPDAAAWQAARPSMKPHELQARCSTDVIVAPGLTAVIVPGALQMPRMRLSTAGDSLSVRLELPSDEGSEFIEVRAGLRAEHGDAVRAAAGAAPDRPRDRAASQR